MGRFIIVVVACLGLVNSSFAKEESSAEAAIISKQGMCVGIAGPYIAGANVVLGYKGEQGGFYGKFGYVYIIDWQ